MSRQGPPSVESSRQCFLSSPPSRQQISWSRRQQSLSLSHLSLMVIAKRSPIHTRPPHCSFTTRRLSSATRPVWALQTLSCFAFSFLINAKWRSHIAGNVTSFSLDSGGRLWSLQTEFTALAANEMMNNLNNVKKRVIRRIFHLNGSGFVVCKRRSPFYFIQLPPPLISILPAPHVFALHLSSFVSLNVTNITQIYQFGTPLVSMLSLRLTSIAESPRYIAPTAHHVIHRSARDSNSMAIALSFSLNRKTKQTAG